MGRLPRFLREINIAAPLVSEAKGKWRLPTEIEWEYVAKAGTNSRWSFGNSDKDLDEHGWHAEILVVDQNMLDKKAKFMGNT